VNRPKRWDDKRELPAYKQQRMLDAADLEKIEKVKGGERRERG
jgi:hypothetical protein